mmetsp:Transcript_14471/g.38464  ORF Transcript_14471/g.38464 Transcript_14471/m.38464 type:complete len:462 (+) Transcript_14471:205-1590(+)
MKTPQVDTDNLDLDDLTFVPAEAPDALVLLELGSRHRSGRGEGDSGSGRGSEGESGSGTLLLLLLFLRLYRGVRKTSALDLGEDLDALAVAQAAARDRHAGVEADVVLEQPEAGRVDALLPGILVDERLHGVGRRARHGLHAVVSSAQAQAQRRGAARNSRDDAGGAAARARRLARGKASVVTAGVGAPEEVAETEALHTRALKGEVQRVELRLKLTRGFLPRVDPRDPRWLLLASRAGKVLGDCDRANLHRRWAEADAKMPILQLLASGLDQVLGGERGGFSRRTGAGASIGNLNLAACVGEPCMAEGTRRESARRAKVGRQGPRGTRSAAARQSPLPGLIGQLQDGASGRASGRAGRRERRSGDGDGPWGCSCHVRTRRRQPDRASDAWRQQGRGRRQPWWREAGAGAVHAPVAKRQSRCTVGGGAIGGQRGGPRATDTGAEKQRYVHSVTAAAKGQTS